MHCASSFDAGPRLYVSTVGSVHTCMLDNSKCAVGCDGSRCSYTTAIGARTTTQRQQHSRSPATFTSRNCL